MKLTAAEIARRVGGKVVGDGECLLSGVATLEEAAESDLSFYHNEKYAEQFRVTRAGCVLAPVGARRQGTVIECEHPYRAFGRVLTELFARTRPAPGVDARAVIAPDVTLGADCAVMPFAVIGARSRLGARAVIHPHVVIGDECLLGDDVTLHPGVVLYPDTVIGSRVTLHAGVIIGADGFGYALEDGRHTKIPQVGRVRIEDDVEIGAATTIDRGTLGETVIGTGSKLDNQVQIGHNVKVGPHNVFAAQVGVAGSVRTGAYVALGGQAGVAGHLCIGDRVQVAGKGGVVRDTPDDATLGFYGLELRDWLRALATFPRLSEMRRELAALKRRLDGQAPQPVSDLTPPPGAPLEAPSTP